MLAIAMAEVFSNNFCVLNPDKTEMDITNRNCVNKVFEQFKPNYVIHTAAITNVDFCEEFPELALQVNEKGTENIAYYSEKFQAKMVYISSCGLFGDEVRPYRETDEVQLKTQYAKSKYLGEIKVKDNCSRYFIVRPGWLFGGTKEHKKNFVYNRYLEAQKKNEIESAVDKFGCPTYTKHLAEKILVLMKTDYFNIYHITNNGYCSRYEYVKKIISCFDNLKTVVKETDSSSFVRKAPVPDCEILENYNLKDQGFNLLPDWQVGIEEYILKLKKSI